MAGIDITPLVPDPTKKKAAPPAASAPVPIPAPAAVLNNDVNTGPKATTSDVQIPSLTLPADSNSALKQVADFAVTGLNASAVAAQKNQAVLQQAEQANDSLFSDVLAANTKMHRINSFGGPDSPIVKIMQLFDGDWNASNLQLDIEAAGVKQQQVNQRAQALMSINNTIPDLIEKQTGIARELFTNTLATQHLALDQNADTRAAVQLRLDAERVAISQSAEARSQADFKIAGMDVGTKQSILDDLKKNGVKSKFASYAPYAGKLQESIVNEQTAETALGNANIALQKNQREEATAQMQTFTDHLPSIFLQQGIQTALKGGSADVEFGNGPKKISIPLSMALQSYNRNLDIEKQANANLAQETSDNANLSSRTRTLVSSASAVATVDPRAASVMSALNASAINLQHNPSPGNVQLYNANLTAREADMKKIVDDFSKQFKSPEAQSAVQQWGTNGGVFNRQGAQAVLEDSIGNASLSRTTKYSGAFTILNGELGNRINQQNVSAGATAFGSGPISQADLMALMAGTKSDKKVNDMKSELINDPRVLNAAATSMKTVINKDALVHAISTLAGSKNASPVWADLTHHAENFTDQNPDGSHTINLDKLAGYLEVQNVNSRGKVDYNGALLTALRSYGANSPSTSANDPASTVWDRALETAVFGEKPHTAVVSDFAYNYGRAVQAAHTAMLERIRQDISGETAQSATTAMRTMGPVVEGLFNPVQGTIDQRTSAQGLPIGGIPSATGANLSAQQIATIYGAKP